MRRNGRCHFAKLAPATVASAASKEYTMPMMSSSPARVDRALWLKLNVLAWREHDNRYFSADESTNNLDIGDTISATEYERVPSGDAIIMTSSAPHGGHFNTARNYMARRLQSLAASQRRLFARARNHDGGAFKARISMPPADNLISRWHAGRTSCHRHWLIGSRTRQTMQNQTKLSGAKL